jgi:hypothetical protein
MAVITSESLVSLAIHVRCKSQDVPEEKQPHRCTVIQPPNCGSFNLLYTLEFQDGVKWVLRIPCPGENGHFTPAASRLIRSEAMTMNFVRENTSIPIPKIYAFDESTNNEVGAPYILMDCVEGFRVSEKWFDCTGPTPLEERRLRILDTVATAMSQLSQFQFHKIGSLEFDSSNCYPTSIGPCNIVDEVVSFEDMLSASGPDVNYRKIGPFNTSQEYFEALLNMQKSPQDLFSKGIRELLKMMIQCIPRSLTKKASELETFVLAHPDFDSQNVVVSEDGTLTALIDWDNIHTVPRCIGYSRYPAWITRDWDPAIYGYSLPNTRPENSPEELQYYRFQYAEKMRTLLSGEFDFSTKSHLFEALWIAVSNPTCTDAIVEKIFVHLFPEDVQEDEDLYLYETAIALAEHTLDREVESVILRALHDLFCLSN